MNIKKTVAATIITTILPAILYGASAQDILKRAGTADKRLNYRGIKTTKVRFSNGVVTAKFKVAHMKPDMTRTDYFSPSAIAGIVVLQDGRSFWKYHPRENEWERISPKVLLSNESECNGFLHNFNLKITGTEKIAGRPAYIIYAFPKSGTEAARRVWVDKEHYMIIGMQVESPNGHIMNSSRYTNLSINPRGISPTIFKVTGRVNRQPQSCGVEFKIMKPSYLPSGYRLTGIMNMRVNGYSCAHLQFSNGANSISLFEHKICNEKPTPPIRSRITNVLVWNKRGISCTIMSDLSKSELRKIANSIR